MRKLLLLSAAILTTVYSLHAQSGTGEIRGIVYEKETGVPIDFANVIIKELTIGSVTDANGFYNIPKVPAGKYTISCSFIGFTTVEMEVVVTANSVTTKNFYMPAVGKDLEEVTVNAERQDKIQSTQIAKTKITPKEMTKLVTLGGEPDLIQSLQILPGVTTSGDQGGQLYVRGGSPVMNKVLLDGMTIYQPFHSIGLFSVFDADIIRSADVYSAGFGAQYGGRISSVVDVSTREGNKTRFAGKISANPFTSKVLLEGPLKKYQEGQGSTSYIFSYKNSYLRQSAPIFYSYLDKNQLPYTFQDLYGKVSFVGSNGSKLDLFGFNFTDGVNFSDTSTFRWASTGFGSRFVVIPDESKVKMDGFFSYSQYKMNLQVGDGEDRFSDIKNFNIGLNFDYLLGKDQFVYGTEITTFRTDFQFTNGNGRSVDQLNNNTELSLFAFYRKVTTRWVIEPGLRIQYYATFSEFFPEPRLALKYNASSRFRLKAAGGLYSQNLISAVSDRDVVNLFYGFLSGPDNLPSSFKGRSIDSRLQKAWHVVGGFEWDITRNIDFLLEGYYKNFYQLTNINRDKLFDDVATYAGKPDYQKKDYVVEQGLAYGMDARVKYEYKGFYLWAVYSLTFVTRDDGIRKYSPHFDRRHNVNLVASYAFGNRKSWEINARWNMGSGFPFTQTEGYYELLRFNRISTNYTTANGSPELLLGPINQGRLPYFHRLDLSIQKTMELSKNSKLQLVAGCINVYNRDNVFYVTRDNDRINQLPILPTLGANLTF